jgi:hypothetical protein
MDNQPSFAERTKQLKEIAFQLKNAAEIVLAEVQLEARKSVSRKRRRPRPTKKPAPKTKSPAGVWQGSLILTQQDYHDEPNSGRFGR